MEKYLYFRKDSTLANDDDPANGSVMYPVSALQGIVVGDSSTAGSVTGNSYGLGADNARLIPLLGDCCRYTGDGNVNLVATLASSEMLTFSGSTTTLPKGRIVVVGYPPFIVRI